MTHCDPTKLSTLYLKIPKENIVFLKFLLESYEGIGLIRTLSSKKGDVVIFCTKSTYDTTTQVINTVKEDLQIEIQDFSYSMKCR